MADFGFTCDACGEILLADSDVRYVIHIRGFAAYDPMEISRSDLDKDLEREMAELLQKMKEMDAERLEDDVHKEFRLDLCPRCWRTYRRDPLAGLRDRLDGGSEAK